MELPTDGADTMVDPHEAEMWHTQHTNNNDYPLEQHNNDDEYQNEYHLEEPIMLDYITDTGELQQLEDMSNTNVPMILNVTDNQQQHQVHHDNEDEEDQDEATANQQTQQQIQHQEQHQQQDEENQIELGETIQVDEDNDIDERFRKHRLTETERFCLELKVLCQAHGPKSMYDSIRKIIQRHMGRGLNTNTNIPSNESFMNTLRKKFMVTKPTEMRVGLNVDLLNTNSINNNHMNITRRTRESTTVFNWSFEKQFRELILSPHIFGDLSKLVVNPEDPWTRYTRDPDDGGEILSSRWMQETYDKYKQMEDFSWETDQIHPIIFYGDKIGTDARQCYHSEPWMFCHAGIKREERNKSTTWRPMGYIPNINLNSSAWIRILQGQKYGRNNSHRNYMAVMSVAMESWKGVTTKPFMAWMRKGNTYKYSREKVDL